MKLLKLMIICNLLILLSACSSKTVDILHGYNEHNISYNFDIKHNLINNQIFI
jgi:hypothetical protein